MKTLVLNGPNLNRLGKREPAIYGSQTLADLADLCVTAGRELGLDVDFRQTNHEGELLEWLHEAADAEYPVVLNAAAWTHTSVAIGDACAQLTAPLVEVHLSNVHKREAFRHHSYVSAHAVGVIAGLGPSGYTAALHFLSEQHGISQHGIPE
ncbi:MULTISPECIES: type II 3-dehydroquinate dehydratase [Glycomyces]|uniref:3-dehydroquinate dehydratase n=2 Tax=Glycomyces TaxID=58113 RepID=A0A9X3PKQ4_9ACTN|nr:type II 3-dehydroquinate dehydratase [Glycomyces lechevalierae]MDA1387040.1 type II 3-dehydroquinate dehydratase [Glycomyces lechevalierae]MDR7336931.1 3-dehydroquinate dehydratase-2 [Glycomyces lechevalierae]